MYEPGGANSLATMFVMMIGAEVDSF